MNDPQKPASPPKQEISDSSIFAAVKDNVYCELEGEAVILNLHDGIYYGLNPVGLRIWELLQSPRTMADVLDSLLKEYEVERETCRTDVINLLNELSDKGLITNCTGR